MHNKEHCNYVFMNIDMKDLEKNQGEHTSTQRPKNKKIDSNTDPSK